MESLDNNECNTNGAVAKSFESVTPTVTKEKEVTLRKRNDGMWKVTVVSRCDQNVSFADYMSAIAYMNMLISENKKEKTSNDLFTNIDLNFVTIEQKNDHYIIKTSDGGRYSERSLDFAITHASDMARRIGVNQVSFLLHNA